jgi:hypothetical protein
MTNDRFIYQKGDIQIRASQCDFCKYNCKDERGCSKAVCSKYPEGKQGDIVQTLKKCPFLEY